MKKSKFFAGLLSVTFISFSLLAQELHMSDKMLLSQAPVPNLQNRKDLMLYADKPSDILISGQKKSLTVVAPQDQLLTNDQILKLYSTQLGSSADLTQGFKVYGNFIDGIKGKKAFDKVELTDQADMWQMVLLNSEQVQESILHLEWFNSGIGGHAQIRFKLSQPILLISQDDPSQTKWISGDIVYTLMALRTVNGNPDWGVATGLTGAFANSYSMATAAHMAAIQTNLDNGSYVEQYQLKLSPMQNQSLLSNVLLVGSQAQEKEVYNLIYNSCIQAAMRALKSVDSRVDEWEFNPYMVLSDLQALGLIEKQLPSVNQEFNSPVQSLQNAQNAKNLAIVGKLRPAMGKAVFSESLRTLADVIIEDRWSSVDLNSVIAVVSQIDLSQASVEQIQGALMKAQSEGKLPAKTLPSAQKLAAALAQVLQRNQMDLQDLMKFFAANKLQ
ncbi:MAG: lipoprotein N-acyltransferase Lnb domain-containing protein [Pseudobdellovibrio sp.]